MKTGKIKWYDSIKGFGFILTDDGKDIFVHRTGLQNSDGLKEGDSVQFEIKDGDKGPYAVNVVVVR